ncbi:hypothetical protein SLE2022_321060 [Rubroshorea leprosula]
MPKRKRLNLVRVRPNNQIEAGLPSSPSINNEVEPSQQSAPFGNNEGESIPQHAVLEETESRAPSPPPRKPRGPTLMSHIWELDKGVKVNVIFDANCHPIGKEGCTLTRFLGTVARKSNVAPISYMEWRDMPQIYKDDMWKIIESKFLIEESRKEQIKSWIMTDVNEKWKSYKNELKSAGFDLLLTVDEMYEKINDPRVDKEQFHVLVEYWRSEKGEKISKQNKENRQKLEEPHCLGTRTFARFVNEKESFAEGRKPSRAELYIQSRMKKDGGPVSEKASQVMEQLKNCMSASTSSASALEETTSWQNDIFSKVKGSDKKGRVRCLGKVPTSKKSIPSTSTNSNVEQRLSEVENMLSGLMQLMKARFPNESITDILQAANELAAANRLDREVNFFVEPFNYFLMLLLF